MTNWDLQGEFYYEHCRGRSLRRPVNNHSTNFVFGSPRGATPTVFINGINHTNFKLSIKLKEEFL